MENERQYYASTEEMVETRHFIRQVLADQVDAFGRIDEYNVEEIFGQKTDSEGIMRDIVDFFAHEEVLGVELAENQIWSALNRLKYEGSVNFGTRRGGTTENPSTVLAYIYKPVE